MSDSIKPIITAMIIIVALFAITHYTTTRDTTTSSSNHNQKAKVEDIRNEPTENENLNQATSVSPKEEASTSQIQPETPTTAAPVVVKKELQVLASIPYWDQEKAFRSFRENVELIDYISLFWYYLDRDGRIQKYTYAFEDDAIINFAHNNGVRVLGLVANLPETEGISWDALRVDKNISDENERSLHVAELVTLAETKNFDGINIDYEQLRDDQTDNFSVFIEELARALHEKNKILTVAIHSRSSNDHTHGQDLVRIGRAADQMVFMTHDENWEDSNAGPVASIDWVSENLKFISSLDVPQEKIFMGTPLYGYDWPLSNTGKAQVGTGVEFTNIIELRESHLTIEEFDDKTASPFLKYTKGGIDHIVWFENSHSVEHKLEAAKEFGIGGAAFWRLGREDPTVWDILEN